MDRQTGIVVHLSEIIQKAGVELFHLVCLPPLQQRERVKIFLLVCPSSMKNSNPSAKQAKAHVIKKILLDGDESHHIYREW